MVWQLVPPRLTRWCSPADSRVQPASPLEQDGARLYQSLQGRAIHDVPDACRAQDPVCTAHCSRKVGYSPAGSQLLLTRFLNEIAATCLMAGSTDASAATRSKLVAWPGDLSCCSTYTPAQELIQILFQTWWSSALPLRPFEGAGAEVGGLYGGGTQAAAARCAHSPLPLTCLRTASAASRCALSGLIHACSTLHRVGRSMMPALVCDFCQDLACPGAAMVTDGST